MKTCYRKLIHKKRITYSWQGKEGDAEEGEPRGQHPPRPRLWRLVSVADGCQGDL